MKTLYAALLAATMIVPAYAQMGDETTAMQAIEANCAREWGTDFAMQLWCRNRQVEAYRKMHPPVQAPPQAEIPTAPPTQPANKLEPLSWRLNQIDQLARASLPTVLRHCGNDAVCRKAQTAAVYDLAAREKAIARALRDPTTYADAIVRNDAVNTCLVSWRASEDFAAAVQCISDASPQQ